MQYADRTGRALGGSTLQDRFLENLYACFLGRMPVSYTHLDVYKRQRQHQEDSQPYLNPSHHHVAGIPLKASGQA